MLILDIIKSLSIPSILVAIFGFYIKKRDKEMSERQENLERYFKPLSLSCSFGDYYTQILDKGQNFYTLKPFLLTILQGDIKTIVLISPFKDGKFGYTPEIIKSTKRIKHEQNTKENYGRTLSCIPEILDVEFYVIKMIDSDNNIRKVKMFSYCPIIEDYAGNIDIYMVIYLIDCLDNTMLDSYVLDKFILLFKDGRVEFPGFNIAPEDKDFSDLIFSSFKSSYIEIRRRVKEELF
ncbi:hypothetical protein [Pseudolactococcus paracarnosus]|uniref:Uncharacterized protein n=1 Tax=Pseudolactococcus paracarnosus TaxID=2749962 RepID=A0ABT0ANA1_9LACT|nr:hypothetical protein [Lactococcus paracarnosus]MCJ1978044.1 hypothetical protein [Lactococcus paracarnosus]MCJ1984124.1 hypothetical protein [Lactococcus paracarnosus]MCJ1999244.1 hypothetical protein [Lactococcus paracarnosus]